MSTEVQASAQGTSQARWSYPSIFGALRGLWLFTWKSQVTWQRLGVGCLALLVFPTLIVLTTPTPQGWAEKHQLEMGSAPALVNGFARRATRAGVPLRPEQRAELLQVISEEFARAEGEWKATPGTEPDFARQRQQSEDCYEQILQRAQTVLDGHQFTEFEAFQRRHRVQRPVVAGEPGWQRTTGFYRCLIDLYFFIVLPLNCVRICGALIRDELEANTLSFLTTRPLTRPRLLLVKFAAQITWLQIWFVVQTLLLLAAGIYRKVPGILGGLILPLLATQVIAVLAWSALGLLLGQISKRYMALALVYGTIVEMGIGRIPTNINSLSLMRHLKTLLSHQPSLQSIFNWPTAPISTPILALLAAAVAFLIVAALLFTYREYHHTNEMQK